MKQPIHIKNCPFCGTEFPDNLEDSLYPSGTVWRDTPHGRTYHSWKNRQEGDSQCWQLICNEIYGGCGVEMHADSQDDVVKKWNRRVNKE